MKVDPNAIQSQVTNFFNEHKTAIAAGTVAALAAAAYYSGVFSSAATEFTSSQPRGFQNGLTSMQLAEIWHHPDMPFPERVRALRPYVKSLSLLPYNHRDLVRTGFGAAAAACAGLAGIVFAGPPGGAIGINAAMSTLGAGVFSAMALAT